MKQVELIEEKQYFTETEKALKLLEEHVDGLSRAASPRDQLEILEELLPKVDDYEQFQELNKEKAALEFKIKYAHESKPLVPEEHREKILSNHDIELAEIDGELAEQYRLLDSCVEELEKTMVPLLINIYRLESRKDISRRLGRYTGGTYCYVDFIHNMRFEHFYGFHTNGIKSSPARAHYEKLKELIDLLKGKRQVGIVRGRR